MTIPPDNVKTEMFYFPLKQKFDRASGSGVNHY